jgi:lysyl-tRNA synthetase class 1
MPLCPKTGIVLQVPIEQVNKERQSVSYRDNHGELIEVPVTGGNCKLQWKPDFGMRWAALDVDYEMYGKDHRPNSELYSKICRILGGKVPAQYFYELFLDADGSKISKSKGNSIGVDEWLHYAPLESISLFMYQSPAKAKRLYFDIIPKCVDEYLTFNKKYHEETDIKQKLINPAFHIHKSNVPQINTFGISFNLLLNLASVCNPKDRNVLWGFISKYAPGATPENAPYLDHMTNFAVTYYNDFVKDTKEYIKLTDHHREVLKMVSLMLSDLCGDETGEEIQNRVYAIGRQAGYENLRDFFKELYQTLLGQTHGPRLSSFFKLYGIDETIDLIKSRLNEEISV